MNDNGNKKGRKPIGDGAMSAAERKRRSRQAKADGVSLESETAKAIRKTAMKYGKSERYIRQYVEVIDNGIPEWLEYYRRHEGKDALSVKRAAIAVRYLDDSQQGLLLKILEETGLAFGQALYYELWQYAESGKRIVDDE